MRIAVFTFALFIVRVSLSTHTLDALVRQPGTAASSCLVVLACRLSAHLAFILVAEQSSHPSLPVARWTSLTGGLGEQVGGSILAVWLAACLLSKSLRIQWDWIEVLGIAFGVIWFLQFFARAVVFGLTGRIVRRGRKRGRDSFWRYRSVGPRASGVTTWQGNEGKETGRD